MIKLPDKCFLSHAYDESYGIEELRNVVPSHVDLNIFEQISVSPDERVSDDLVRAIMDCDAVVVLFGRKAKQSFWVNFERDFAKRIGKSVYIYDPQAREIKPDRTPVRKLDIYAHYTPYNRTTMDEIFSWIRTERKIDINETWEDIKSNWQAQLKKMRRTLSRKGVLVAFFDEVTLEDEEYCYVLSEAYHDWPDRIIPVMVDAPEFVSWQSHWMADVLEKYDIQCIANDPGDHIKYDHLWNWNSVDDLIVKIYYKCYS